MSVPEPSAYFLRVAEELRRLGARAALVGGMAANVHRAEPRYTTDVDFLVDVVDGVAEHFREEGHQVREIADPGELPHLLMVRSADEKIDVIRVTTPYQAEALDRAVNGVITAEDVIIHKLIAWRPRDENDVLSIVAAGASLDEAYIERWAAEWEVLDRWRQARPLP